MKTVSEIMVSMPYVVEVPGRRSDAIDVMVKYGLTGLPVVRSSDGQLVGIISRKDVFKKFDEEQLSLIMKKEFIRISPDASIKEAAEIFIKKRIHRLPVVDKGKLVGIITPTDLLDEVKDLKTPMTAGDVIRTTCVTVYEKDPLSYAVSSMRISDVFALPVLDAKGMLVGIITDRDLFVDQPESNAEAMKQLGINRDEDFSKYRSVLPLFYVATNKTISEELLVDKYMVKDPVTVFKKTSLSEVAKIMKAKDFGQIPVHGNKDELVGMIYDVDVLCALVGNPDES